MIDGVMVHDLDGKSSSLSSSVGLYDDPHDPKL